MVLVCLLVLPLLGGRGDRRRQGAADTRVGRVGANGAVLGLGSGWPCGWSGPVR